MALGNDLERLRFTERNTLLRELEPDDYARLARRMDEVPLRAGTVLAPPGERSSHAWFPQAGVVSQVAVFRTGGSVEVGTIGREGVVGVPIFLGVGSTPHLTIVQVDAVLRRLPADAFEAALAEVPALDPLVRRYLDAYMLQVSQTAACNRMHELRERAARWLLMTHDRVGADTFALTHEFLATMLGVRRAGVSEAAAELQRKGAIRYSRGRVMITDRRVLARQSCECYEVVRNRFDALARRSERSAAAD